MPAAAGCIPTCAIKSVVSTPTKHQVVPLQLPSRSPTGPSLDSLIASLAFHLAFAFLFSSRLRRRWSRHRSGCDAHGPAQRLRRWIEGAVVPWFILLFPEVFSGQILCETLCRGGAVS